MSMLVTAAILTLTCLSFHQFQLLKVPRKSIGMRSGTRQTLPVLWSKM